MPKSTHLIAGLYRSLGSCADHHDQATVRLLHIECQVDDYVRECAKRGGVLFVTGNPGDGKTHLLRRLEADLKADGVATALDANELPDDELVRRVDRAYSSKRGGLALAINEGVLVNLLAVAANRPWARIAQRQLLQPTVLGNGAEALDDRLRVVDLSLRNNLAPDVVGAALDAIERASPPCDGCPGNCALQSNLRRIAHGEVRNRLFALLAVIARSGFHATMRDVQGFLSYLLCGGRTCEELKAGATVSAYWDNAFEGGDGPLFAAVGKLAPEAHPTPLLDDLLWRGATSDSEWLLSRSVRRADAESLEDRFAAFRNEKRRCLFEHRQGASILDSAMSPRDRVMAELMEGGRRAAAILVRYLNRFFDRDETTSELLYLWTTHRYDSRPSRFAAAFAAVPVSDLEVLVPRLHPQLTGGFPDYQAPSVYLSAKATSTMLRIDGQLITALLGAESGMPATFRRGEPEARIAAFYDRLARRRSPDAASCTVRLVDMDTGGNMQVEVDVARREFRRA